MILHLNKDWRVTTDSHNYTLEKKSVIKNGDNAGKEIYRAVAFYPNIEWCIRGVINREIMDNEVEGLKDIKEHLYKVKNEILNEIKKLESV